MQMKSYSLLLLAIVSFSCLHLLLSQTDTAVNTYTYVSVIKSTPVIGRIKGISLDTKGKGDLYIADSSSHVVRVMRYTAGYGVSIIAGTGSSGYSGDGASATSATLNTPSSAVVNGNTCQNGGYPCDVYIADTKNNRIRLVSSATGVITTLAGTGSTSPVSSSIGDGGPATSAILYEPSTLAVDSTFTYLYFTDTRNYRIRRIALTSSASSLGIITTIVGTGTTTGTAFDDRPGTNVPISYPFGLALDSSNNLYYSDSLLHVVRKYIVSCATSATTPTIVPTIAPTFSPTASCSVGNVYNIAGQAGMTSASLTSTSNGDGNVASAAYLTQPSGVSLDKNGNVYIAEFGANRIRKVSVNYNSVIQTIAGCVTSPCTNDNVVATSIILNGPQGIVFDSKTETISGLYIADTENSRILKLINAPTQTPTSVPTTKPTFSPSPKPTLLPTPLPTVTPTSLPSPIPTLVPSSIPTAIPLSFPTSIPTSNPTERPTRLPTPLPTVIPSDSPTEVPSEAPSQLPTTEPSYTPSSMPSYKPSPIPTAIPTRIPTMEPTVIPTRIPTDRPTHMPSEEPSEIPTDVPTSEPSTAEPTTIPTSIPSTARPTEIPTDKPTIIPSVEPTPMPTFVPGTPTALPTTGTPSVVPTPYPSSVPTIEPTDIPTATPSLLPSSAPSTVPTHRPSLIPTSIPTRFPTVIPTDIPTDTPTLVPTDIPTDVPTDEPSSVPTDTPTDTPSITPTRIPSRIPTNIPTLKPTTKPTVVPTLAPTSSPSSLPSSQPSSQPLSAPTLQPVTSAPSSQPSSQPSSEPSLQPSSHPSSQPSSHPSSPPSSAPVTTVPTSSPTSIPSSSPTSHPTEKLAIIPSYFVIRFALAQMSVIDWNSTSISSFTFRSSIASLLEVSSKDIVLFDIVDIDWDVYYRGFITPNYNGTYISAKVSFFNQKIGGEFYQAYDKLVYNLMMSVTPYSDNATSTIQYFASQYLCTSLRNVSVIDYDLLETLTVMSLQTSQPSVAVTIAPIVSKLFNKMIVTIVLSVMSCVIAFVIYYIYNRFYRRKGKKLNMAYDKWNETYGVEVPSATVDIAKRALATSKVINLKDLGIRRKSACMLSKNPLQPTVPLSEYDEDEEAGTGSGMSNIWGDEADAVPPPLNVTTVVSGDDEEVHYDEEGYQVWYDKNGLQFYYDEKGLTYYYDEDGTQQYYNQNDD